MDSKTARKITHIKVTIYFILYYPPMGPMGSPWAPGRKKGEPPHKKLRGGLGPPIKGQKNRAREQEQPSAKFMFLTIIFKTFSQIREVETYRCINLFL